MSLEFDQNAFNTMMAEHAENNISLQRRVRRASRHIELALKDIGIPNDIKVICAETNMIIDAACEHAPGSIEEHTDLLRAWRYILIAAWRIGRGCVKGIDRRVDPSIPPDLDGEDDAVVL